MSEDLDVVDPDIAPPAPDPAPAADPAPEPAPPAEDEIPEAVEVQPGVRVVPVSVVQALRNELKALKPQAQRAQELEQQVNQYRPYAEFLQQNQHLLHPPQPAPAPVAQADDPALVEYARTLDLYTADGRPDTGRAQKLRDMTRQEAQAIAQQTVAPMQEATHAQAAAQNLQWMTSLKDANGQPLEEQFIIETVRSVYGNMSRTEAIKTLADPNVAQVLANTAMGRQAMSKPFRPAPVAPSAAPLHVEAAGGNAPIQVSDTHTKRLGIGQADYVDRAKSYQPGKSNVLE